MASIFIAKSFVHRIAQVRNLSSRASKDSKLSSHALPEAEPDRRDRSPQTFDGQKSGVHAYRMIPFSAHGTEVV